MRKTELRKEYELVEAEVNDKNQYTLGCPSLTCFFENKKVQPISVVFGGWFEVSQKDFWFGQVSGGAQGRQKSD